MQLQQLFLFLSPAGVSAIRPCNYISNGARAVTLLSGTVDSSTQTAWRRITMPPTHMLDAKLSRVMPACPSVIKLSA